MLPCMLYVSLSLRILLFWWIWICSLCHWVSVLCIDMSWVLNLHPGCFQTLMYNCQCSLTNLYAGKIWKRKKRNSCWFIQDSVWYFLLTRALSDIYLTMSKTSATSHWTKSWCCTRLWLSGKLMLHNLCILVLIANPVESFMLQISQHKKNKHFGNTPVKLQCVVACLPPKRT